MLSLSFLLLSVSLALLHTFLSVFLLNVEPKSFFFSCFLNPVRSFHFFSSLHFIRLKKCEVIFFLISRRVLHILRSGFDFFLSLPPSALRSFTPSNRSFCGFNGSERLSKFKLFLYFSNALFFLELAPNVNKTFFTSKQVHYFNSG